VTTQEESLAPLRETLLARAEEYARRVLADAEATATGTLERARADAAQIVETAREQGAADAQEVLTSQRARVRGLVRALVLQTQRAAYDDLRRTARADARRLVADGPGLATRLAGLGRDRVGEEACVSAQPDGTVVAERGVRRWEWSPDMLADDAVLELGEKVEQLWAL
jgi:cell division septum initiation protein DivIVA